MAMFTMKDIFKNIKKYPQLKYLYDLVDWDLFLLHMRVNMDCMNTPL